MNIWRKMGSLGVAAAGLVTVACGPVPAPASSGQGSGPGSGPGSAQGSAPGSSQGSGAPGEGPVAKTPVNCVTPVLSQGSFTLTEHDNGKTFCVTVGTSFFVFLHGSLAHKWSHPTPSSSDLVSKPSGVFTLPVGVTGGRFEATRTGKVSLVSARAGCGQPGQCAGPSSFAVRLVILGKM